jgi:dolichyl-phosphate beta-glucosyltransferase
MGHPTLSIVIPAFNEARRLGDTLRRIRQYAADAGSRWEVIVVDDGSGDDTGDVVRQFAADPLRVQLLVNPVNRGKGHSVRRAMLAATGDVVLMCDADLSAPIEELEKVRPWLDRGFDLVIGSRDMPDSLLDPPQPRIRRLLAVVFRAVRRRMMLPALRDTQCGFKLFRQAAARDVFARQTVDGWLFDCEVLGLAQRLGYRIKEIGITWQHRPESRVRLLREVFAAVPRLLAIRQRVSRVPRYPAERSAPRHSAECSDEESSPRHPTASDSSLPPE